MQWLGISLECSVLKDRSSSAYIYSLFRNVLKFSARNRVDFILPHENTTILSL